MQGSALSPAERRFLEALNDRGVRFMVVGLGAAVLQGATVATNDIDLWFENLGDPRITEAAREAGGLYAPGSFGMQPPTIGGDQLGDRFDVVTHMHGLGSFAEEWANSREVDVDGIPVRVLSLSRVVESKRATGRAKDVAVLPALEAALAAIEDKEK
jgi:predicted nucleotidyltransferase